MTPKLWPAGRIQIFMIFHPALGLNPSKQIRAFQGWNSSLCGSLSHKPWVALLAINHKITVMQNSNLVFVCILATHSLAYLECSWITNANIFLFTYILRFVYLLHCCTNVNVCWHSCQWKLTNRGSELILAINMTRYLKKLITTN